MATPHRPGQPPGYPRRRVGFAALSRLGWVVVLILGLIAGLDLLAVWY